MITEPTTCPELDAAPVVVPNSLHLLTVVRDDLTPEQVAVACQHAAAAACIRWAKDPLMFEWADKSFRKIIRMANKGQFDYAKKESPHLLMTESSLGNRETCMVLVMSREYPKFFNYLPRYNHVKAADRSLEMIGCYVCPRCENVGIPSIHPSPDGTYQCTACANTIRGV